MKGGKLKCGVSYFVEILDINFVHILNTYKFVKELL